MKSTDGCESVNVDSIIRSIKYGRIEDIEIANGKMVSQPKRIIKKIKVDDLSGLTNEVGKIDKGVILKIEVTGGKIAIVHIEQHI